MTRVVGLTDLSRFQSVDLLHNSLLCLNPWIPADIMYYCTAHPPTLLLLIILPINSRLSEQLHSILDKILSRLPLYIMKIFLILFLLARFLISKFTPVFDDGQSLLPLHYSYWLASWCLFFPCFPTYPHFDWVWLTLKTQAVALLMYKSTVSTLHIAVLHVQTA